MSLSPPLLMQEWGRGCMIFYMCRRAVHVTVKWARVGVHSLYILNMLSMLKKVLQVKKKTVSNIPKN